MTNKKTPQTILSKHGFRADTLGKVHDYALSILDDKEQSQASRDKAARTLISLAKEIVDMERKLMTKPGRRLAKQRVADRDKNAARELVANGVEVTDLQMKIVG